jgi:hypothetical protein
LIDRERRWARCTISLVSQANTEQFMRTPVWSRLPDVAGSQVQDGIKVILANLYTVEDA